MFFVSPIIQFFTDLSTQKLLTGEDRRSRDRYAAVKFQFDL